jgi:fatty acid desaturase
MNHAATISRKQSVQVNRITTFAAISIALGSYFWQPTLLIHYVLDIVLRAYLHFVGGSMAHESVHGHLGDSRSSNSWWGRFALIPTTVPFVIFRKTHLQHHASTNVPGKDPDEFLNTPHRWEIPFRAWALPYHWVRWLKRNRQFSPSDRFEYAATYVVEAAIYGTIAYFVGIERLILGLLPACTIHSLLLWYAFAIKTHEGYSIGAAETRSHNYYGRPLYWFSFGLSMHRLHHMQPRLAWLQMANEVPRGTWAQRLQLHRDIAS